MKYIAGKEEHQLVDIAGSKDITSLSVNTSEHAHEKINQPNRILHEKETKNPHHGREISLAEVVWFILGFPYTHCTADFVLVPTLPLENRAAVRRYGAVSSNVLHAVASRISANLPPWRLFTPSQQAHLEEYINSSYHIDNTSAFNLRPPELLIFDDLQQYNECFIPVSTRKITISENIAAYPWMDGGGRIIKLRSCSIAKCISHLECKLETGSLIAGQLLREVFWPIQNGSTTLEEIFVESTIAREVVSVISLVKPWETTHFMTHLCLSLGKYETEMDLFCKGDIKEAFYMAGLVPSSTSITRFDVLQILRKYVIFDLAFHPITARQFSRYLQGAMDTLENVLLDGAHGSYTPTMSEITLKEQASEMLKKF